MQYNHAVQHSDPALKRSPLHIHQQMKIKPVADVSHNDTITTLTLIEVPYRCVVAGDRNGAIRVWE